MVGLQQSAQTLDAGDLAFVSFVLWLDDPGETLVNPLVMLVLEILAQDTVQPYCGLTATS